MTTRIVCFLIVLALQLVQATATSALIVHFTPLPIWLAYPIAFAVSFLNFIGWPLAAWGMISAWQWGAIVAIPLAILGWFFAFAANHYLRTYLRLVKEAQDLAQPKPRAAEMVRQAMRPRGAPLPSNQNAPDGTNT
jgi:hypothetical protein